MVEPSRNGAKEVSGTIYGYYDYAFEGKGAWVGHAILSISGSQPVKARIVDRNTFLVRSADGAISGTETISLSFSDGASFQVLGTFTGTPAATPGLYTLHETGIIANGTGAYDHATGQVSIEGPFLLPDPSVTPGPPPWVAEIHGSIQGLQ